METPEPSPEDDEDRFDHEAASRAAQDSVGMADSPIPASLSDPRWAHYRDGVANEFVETPDTGTREDDWAQLTGALGADVLNGPQAEVAADWLMARDQARELEPDDQSIALFAQAIGPEEVNRMIVDAVLSGDDQDTELHLRYAAESDPRGLMDAILRGCDFYLEQLEAETLNPDEPEEPEPPVSWPLVVQRRGASAENPTR